MRFDALRAEYADLWREMKIRPERLNDVRAAARRVLAGKVRYEAVAAETGVPWFVVGLIHKMEGSCDFTTHLHNGDPLTARTVHVPRGRPKTGTAPFHWVDSATDAIRVDELDQVPTGDWTIERIAFELEKFNGFGSRGHKVNTAYLWSFTENYSRGKYEHDGPGGWNPNAVSQQSGAMAVLKCMMEVNTTVAPGLETDDGPHVVVDETEVLPRTRTIAATPAADLAPVSRKVRLLEQLKLWAGVGSAGVGLTSMSDTFEFSKGLSDAIRTVLADHVLLVVFGASAGFVVLAFVLLQWIGEDHARGDYRPSGSA